MASTRSRIMGFVTHPFVYNSVIITTAYWLLALALSPDQSTQVSNYVLLSMSVAVLTIYVPAAWFAETQAWRARGAGRYLEAHRWRRAAILATGVVLVVLAVGLSRAWSIVYRVTHWWWMMDSHWLGYFSVIALWGYVHHVISPDAIEEGIPGRSWIRVGLALGAGLLAAGLLIGLGYDPELTRP